MTLITSIPAAEYLLSAKAVQPAPDQLRVHYEFTNNSFNSVYLFNRLARLGGASVFDTDPNAVNIILTADRVTVGKTLLPLPVDKEVERQYVPCMTHVAPHETYQESILCNLPLFPFTWYASRPMRRTPVQRPLFFELGYTVASSDTEKLIQLLDTEDGPLYCASWFPIKLQAVITSGLLLPEVPVLSER